MDKALEIIMVAVILVVASVVIIAMLQGQTQNFGNYSREQTQGSSCGLAQQRLATSIDCSETDAVGYPAYENNKDCWPSSSEALNSVCP
jgi:type II secretory pathway pseudopilin PulG